MSRREGGSPQARLVPGTGAPRLPADRLALPHATIDLQQAVVARADGTQEKLTDLECRLLGYLLRQPGRRVPRAELQREVWGYNATLSTRAVDMAVSRLRKKIEAANGPRLIASVRGGGYRLVLARLEDRVAAVGRELARLDTPEAADALQRLRQLKASPWPLQGSADDRASRARLDAALELVEGTWKRRVELLQACVDELDDEPAGGEVRYELATALLNTDHERASAELRWILEESDDADLRCRSLVQLAWMTHQEQGATAARSLLDNYDFADASDVPLLHLQASRVYAEHLCGQLPLDDTLEQLRAFHDELRAHGDLRISLKLAFWMGRLQRNDGDLQGARATRARCRDDQALLADRLLQGCLDMEEGFDAAHQRRFEESLDWFDRASAIFKTVEPIRFRNVQSCRGLVLLELRRYDEAREELESCAAWARRASRLPWEQHARKLLALLHLDQGYAERARRVAEKAVALGREAGDRFQLMTAWLQLATALQRLGEHEQAAALYGQIESERLPLAARATTLLRAAALARVHGEPPFEETAEALQRLLDHDSVPEKTELAELLAALRTGEPGRTQQLRDEGVTVEVRVAARVVLDALQPGR